MVARSEFDAWVGARSAHLLRTAYLLTRDRSSAEDLLQTALARCWFAWDRIRDDPEAYVRASMANTYCTWWRRRWRGEIPTGELPEPPAGRDPLGAVDDREALWRALGRLPRRQRAVIVLRYFEDQTESQVAAALGIALGTVKSHHAKAMATLRLDETLLDDQAVGNGSPR